MLNWKLSFSSEILFLCSSCKYENIRVEPDLERRTIYDINFRYMAHRTMLCRPGVLIYLLLSQVKYKIMVIKHPPHKKRILPQNKFINNLEPFNFLITDSHALIGFHI